VVGKLGEHWRLNLNHNDAGTLGTQRRAVASGRADLAAQAEARRQRAAARRYPFSASWRAVDSGHRGAVAGDAQEIPAVSDLPSTLSAVGAVWKVGEGVAKAGPATAGGGPLESGRGLHRRHVRSREKRGLAVGPTKRGKGTKITAITVGDSVPIAVSVQAASPHESQLVEEAIGHSFLDELPERLIGDKAYDSDGLDRQMREQYGIEVIAPHRSDRLQPTQDGRPLRRYRRRWTIERLFAWLQVYRRLANRWEYHIENFFGMVRLGCMKIMLRYF
jgi:transposase